MRGCIWALRCTMVRVLQHDRLLFFFLFFLSALFSSLLQSLPAGQSFIIDTYIHSFIHSCVLSFILSAYTEYTHFIQSLIHSLHIYCPHSLYINLLFRQHVTPSHRFVAILPPFPQCHLNLFHHFESGIHFLRLPRWSL